MFFKYPKKIKVILYLPLALFFIANLFYYPLPSKAAPNTSMPNLDINKLQVQIPTLTKFTQPTECGTDAQGNKKICIPWIGEYIAAIYKYAIGIVGILAAVVLMIGGVMWIVAGGSATMIGEAKSWIGASLTGLVIALCSYLILYQVNPALTIFGPLGIAQVKKAETPISGMRLCRWEASCQSGWEISDEKLCPKKETASETVCCCVKPIAACQPVTVGSCSVANLTIFGDKAGQASAICNGESANGQLLESTTDKCKDGKSFSIGLFQINLTQHQIAGFNCPNAFDGKNYNCTVKDNTLYKNCVDAAKDPDTNIQKAYDIYNMGYNWNQWGFYTSTCKSYF